MKAESRHRRLWTICIFAFIALVALEFQMRGPLISVLQDDFALSQSLLGLIAPAGTIGFIISILITGMLFDNLDLKGGMFFGMGLVGLSIFLMGLAPTYLVFLGGLLIRGIITGVPRGLARPILSHLYPDQVGRVFNLYGLAWGVGAVCGPLYVNFVLSIGSWRMAYLFLGVVFVGLLAVLYTLEAPIDTTVESSINLQEFSTILRKPAVGGMSLGLILNGGIEGSFFIWLPYYANQFYSQELSNVVLSGYFSMYIVGRLLFSRVTERFGYLRLVIVNVLLVTLLLILTFRLATGWLWIVSVLATGLIISPIFPTMSAYGINQYPEHSGPINAIAIASAYLGISIFPSIIGLVADAEGIRFAMNTPIILGLLVFVIISWMALRPPASAR